MNVIIVDEDCTITSLIEPGGCQSHGQQRISVMTSASVASLPSFSLTMYLSLSPPCISTTCIYLPCINLHVSLYFVCIYLVSLSLSLSLSPVYLSLVSISLVSLYLVSIYLVSLSLVPLYLCDTDLLYLPRELRSSSISAWCCSSKVSIDFG